MLAPIETLPTQHSVRAKNLCVPLYFEPRYTVGQTLWYCRPVTDFDVALYSSELTGLALASERASSNTERLALEAGFAHHREVIFAHGVGVRADLPIPVSAAQYAAVAVLVTTFALAAKLWRRPMFNRAGGRAVPRLQQVVDSAAVTVLLRVVGVLGLVVTLAVLLLDTNEVTPNPAPTWFYVWFWVGLVPASILFGPIWRRIDPLPVLSAGLRRLLQGNNEALRPYPSAWGMWPAALGLFAFVWMELVATEGSAPETVARFIIAYSLVHVMMGAMYGPIWHERAAAFSVYSDFIARMSPWERHHDGRLVVANPLRNLSSFQPVPGSLVVVVVMLGSTAFDGLSRTVPWVRRTTDLEDASLMLLGTLGLIGTIAIVTLVFLVAIQIAAGGQKSDSSRTGVALSSAFASSLIPIAVGYAIAHYFSLFVFQGQAGYILSNDPFDSGWSLFGSAQSAINYTVVSSSLIAWVQVVAIVAGHIIGVLVAHEQSTKLFRPSTLGRAQLPLLVAMAAFTFGGIGLLLGT